MKASKIVGIVCWSIVAVLLVSLLTSTISTGNFPFRLCFGNIKSGNNILNYSYTYKNTVPINDIENINVNWTDSYVNITEYDGDKIQLTELSVKELADNEKMEYSVNGNTLTISSKSKSIFFFIGGVWGQALEIKIPKSFSAKNISVNTTSADINAENVNTASMYFETTSGDIKADNISANDMTSKSVSGDLSLTGKYEELKINTTSGEVKLNGSVKNNISAESVSGDLNLSTDICPDESISIKTVSGESELSIPENRGFTAYHSSVSGDITVEFPVTEKGDTRIYKDGSIKINTESVSGDVSIIKK